MLGLEESPLLTRGLLRSSIDTLSALTYLLLTLLFHEIAYFEKSRFDLCFAGSDCRDPACVFRRAGCYEYNKADPNA
jgi:hypothetical protein